MLSLDAFWRFCKSYDYECSLVFISGPQKPFHYNFSLSPLRRLSIMSGSFRSGQLNFHRSMFFMAATWFWPWVWPYYFIMMVIEKRNLCPEFDDEKLI